MTESKIPKPIRKSALKRHLSAYEQIHNHGSAFTETVQRHDIKVYDLHEMESDKLLQLHRLAMLGNQSESMIVVHLRKKGFKR